jgi:hypothetical protein
MVTYQSTPDGGWNTGCNQCNRESALHVLSLEDGIPISEHYLCSEHALPLFEQYNSQASAFPSSASALYKDVACVEIKALIGSKDGWSVASLHEKGGRAHFTLE